MINIRLFLKGAAMGGADLIPGVSGGTVALITGIYEDLIDSIRSFDAKALQLLFKFKIRQLWDHVNGLFLVHVLAGILASAFSLASLMGYLLENEPISLWSFFFGLILISVFLVLPREKALANYVAFAVGTLAAYFITAMSPTETPTDLWFVLLSGAIAICAMILPGISGSFILVLLAKYEFILAAIKSFDLKVIATFGVGCILGLVTFSKLIHWLLSHYRSITLASLAGFMLGSLNKIWPWKIENGISFQNVTPGIYEELTGQPHQMGWAISFAVFGFVAVWLLERLGKKVS